MAIVTYYIVQSSNNLCTSIINWDNAFTYTPATGTYVVTTAGGEIDAQWTGTAWSLPSLPSGGSYGSNTGIATADINDGAATLAKLDRTGATGKVLTAQGTNNAPIWADAAGGGATLLGTINTTSGAFQSLTGLTLTSYKFLVLVLQGVSHSSGTSSRLLVGTSATDDVNMTDENISSSATMRGFVWINLENGTFVSHTGNAGTSASVGVGGGGTYAGDSAVTTASTAVGLGLSAAANFDAGSVLVYGVS